MFAQSDFAGAWRMTRHIDDRFAKQRGVFFGQAILKRNGETVLHYHEAGQLRLDQGPAMRAERNYIWQFAGGHVDVSFADGRPFHRFVPEGHVAGSDHPCGDDYYTVRYDFTKWPEWQAVWSVTGPRKDYTSYTTYVRISGT